VCLHTHPAKSGDAARGMCVRATARFVPAHSTKIQFTFCESSNASCPAYGGTWDLVPGTESDAWSSRLGLPLDSMWAETYNQPLLTLWRLTESAGMDGTVMALGVIATAVAAALVAASRVAYSRHLKDR